MIACVVLLLSGSASALVAPPPSVSHRHTSMVIFAGEEKEGVKGQITFQGLMELVTLGLGAPNLGKFKGVDKETGALQFELESNRFITKDGKEYNSFDNSKGARMAVISFDATQPVLRRDLLRKRLR